VVVVVVVPVCRGGGCVWSLSSGWCQVWNSPSEPCVCRGVVAVYDHDYFKVEDFPSNLPGVWDDMAGWLVPTLDKAVIVGEWGGSCVGESSGISKELTG
jgi:hypothetical protein